tara:strand:+ start:507 stop:734 length:228 start_codon:yes stop_codon:yes gene_type:complete
VTINKNGEGVIQNRQEKNGKERVGKYPNSLKHKKVPIKEFEQTFDYGLKYITKLDEFNQVADWENSYFYQTSTGN